MKDPLWIKALENLKTNTMSITSLKQNQSFLKVSAKLQNLIQGNGTILKSNLEYILKIKSCKVETLLSFSNEKPDLRSKAYEINNINNNNKHLSSY